MPTGPAHVLTADVITTVAELRSLIGEPAEAARVKISARLNPQTRIFIERSPFVCMATSDAAGHCDVSPRGDPAGFVRNPRIGLLFVVPGTTDTFRVNGRATLTVDADLLAPSAVEGRPPRLGILVDIEKAYTQCSKAFLRSQLWDPKRFVDPASMPTGGEVLRAIRGESFDAAAYDRERDERYRRRVGFY